jgi:hypothetical protein
MRISASFMTLLCVGAVSPVFAADPPAAPAAPAASGQSQPAPRPPVSDTATAPLLPGAGNTPAPPAGAANPEATAADNKDSAVVVKQLRAAGYRPEQHNGETYYCRKDAQLGTRFETKSCGTAQQLAQISALGSEWTQKVQKSNLTPPKGAP